MAKRKKIWCLVASAGFIRAVLNIRAFASQNDINSPILLKPLHMLHSPGGGSPGGLLQVRENLFPRPEISLWCPAGSNWTRQP